MRVLGSGPRPCNLDDALVREIAKRRVPATQGVAVLAIRAYAPGNGVFVAAQGSSGFDEAVFLREEVAERGVAATERVFGAFGAGGVPVVGVCVGWVKAFGYWLGAVWFVYVFGWETGIGLTVEHVCGGFRSS